MEPNDVIRLIELAADIPCDDETFYHDTCREQWDDITLWCASCCARQALPSLKTWEKSNGSDAG